VVADRDLVFKALADPTRRAVLDALFESDGQSVGALCGRFPDMTRFGVMKHLAVLSDADLVVGVREGRTKRHFLNPVPIEQVANRWISRYAARFTSALVSLDQQFTQQVNEHRSSGRTTPMSTTRTEAAHVYQIYIAATPEDVWIALTESDWLRRWLHGTSYTEPPEVGVAFRTVTADGHDAIEGLVSELRPPSGDRPGRFVHGWHVLYDPEAAAEPGGQVEWTVQRAGEALTLVRLVHSGLEESPRTSDGVKDGWVWVLNSLKTVLETGRTLPPVTVET
jgi:uncharacterized protein YndB with AHSA1/START domain/DNA-binding transcriptional ArsR family regulator